MAKHETTIESGVTRIVRELLAAHAIHRPLAPDDDLRAAGLTSLDLVNLVLAVEAEFDLSIPMDAITPANFRNVASIEALLVALAADASAAAA